MTSVTLPPISEGIATAAARLVDDVGSSRRPSHWDLELIIKECSLEVADPKASGASVGKAKRVPAVLFHALQHNRQGGQDLLGKLVSLVRGEGGFRSDSENFVGQEAIRNLQAELSAFGFELTDDGHLRPVVLESLEGIEVTEALAGYAQRAQQGASDAALVVGTGKDLLEATAAHVLVERGFALNVISGLNFPDLLAMAFVNINFATTQTVSTPATPRQRLELAWYDAACSINTLRNKQGTGHGHPFLPTVSAADAKSAVQQMGIIAAAMLEAL